MKEAEKFNKAASILQYALLTALLAVLVLFACTAYKKVNESKNHNYDSRAQLSYMANKISAGDASGCVSVRRDGVLVIADVGDDYETRFYLSSGVLMEEYAKAEAAVNPEKASPIGETSGFKAEINNNVVTLSTDLGTIAVSLRSS